MNNPGKFERHLLRKQGNPLFPARDQVLTPVALEQAREKDQVAAKAFADDFQQLVQRAVDLKPNAPSEEILELKEELDRCFQLSYTLPGDAADIRQAIQRLLDSIMRAVWKGIGNDHYARQQLEDEEIARKLHFQLQQNALIADLTDSDSPIQASELIPALLSEKPESIAQVLQIFDAQQIVEIYNEAVEFLEKMDPGKNLDAAWDRLAVIKNNGQVQQHEH